MKHAKTIALAALMTMSSNMWAQGLKDLVVKNIIGREFEGYKLGLSVCKGVYLEAFRR